MGIEFVCNGKTEERKHEENVRSGVWKARIRSKPALGGSHEWRGKTATHL
uniref:Uncharacterized protein n=1 Tax=Setaria italica TaxID=4555 RepID=K3ZBU4_SETIT